MTIVFFIWYNQDNVENNKVSMLDSYHQALKDLNVDQIKRLVDSNTPGVNKLNFNKMSPLMRAVRQMNRANQENTSKYVQIIEQLLTHPHIDVNLTDGLDTPLSWAISIGRNSSYPKVVDLLLRNQNMKVDEGEPTALAFVVQDYLEHNDKQSREKIIRLLNHGASLLKVNCDFWNTPTFSKKIPPSQPVPVSMPFYAVIRGHNDVLKALLENRQTHGFDIEAPQSEQVLNSPLLGFALAYQNYTTARMLIEADAKLDVSIYPDMNSLGPLFPDSNSEDKCIPVKQWLKSHEFPKSSSSALLMLSILQRLSAESDRELIEHLSGELSDTYKLSNELIKYVGISKKDKSKLQELDLTSLIKTNDFALIKWFFENTQGQIFVPNNKTILHEAIKSSKNIESIEIIDYLIQKGACVDSKDTNGDTPLHIAIRSSQLDKINVIFDKVNNYNDTNNNNESYLDLAIKTNNIDLVRKLLNQDVSPNSSMSMSDNTFILALSLMNITILFLLFHKVLSNFFQSFRSPDINQTAQLPVGNASTTPRAHTSPLVPTAIQNNNKPTPATLKEKA